MMDRESLMEVIRKGPVRITMNSGDTFEVPGIEFAIVDETAAYVLRRAADGKLRAAILPLVTMSVVEPIAEAA